MNTKEKSTFLGTGWHFPIKFSAYTKDVTMVSNAECIVQNIRMLLSTRQGERPMYPEYGHQLYIMIFETMDQTLIYRVKEHLEYIFMIHEPRITLEDIIIEEKEDYENIILIDLHYLIRESNTRTNLVFPYYLIEK
ncbi:GPW/gp25 family protein [Flavivirga jejuensis]|uniref:GPW/gp25 family protein n=1 Tax=Flavivirga jejuensis TaxID=870487 RepID=A0ABT8WP46_9FLAO|nr:GPW/gp25 family protein [Flavivirga jejuensis]MDO5974924.1 GPW/gp25 family protein [Flavivirga jejuensis]